MSEPIQPMDPSEAVAIRLQASADQLGAAVADAFKLSFRKAIAQQLVEEYGPGPWLLYPDGHVEVIRRDDP
jgi:hypothetical protein